MDEELHQKMSLRGVRSSGPAIAGLEMTLNVPAFITPPSSKISPKVLSIIGIAFYISILYFC
jgi:hypothetical protein